MDYSNSNSILFFSLLLINRKNTGIRILLDKCLGDFDAIAEKLMRPETSKDEQSKLLEEAQSKASKLSKDDDKKSADVYIKVMQKVIERGPKFVESEKVRVKNIMDGKISTTKKNELQARLNILTSFLESSDKSKVKKEDL